MQMTHRTSSAPALSAMFDGYRLANVVMWSVASPEHAVVFMSHILISSWVQPKPQTVSICLQIPTTDIAMTAANATVESAFLNRCSISGSISHGKEAVKVDAGLTPEAAAGILSPVLTRVGMSHWFTSI